MHTQRSQSLDNTYKSVFSILFYIIYFFWSRLGKSQSHSIAKVYRGHKLVLPFRLRGQPAPEPQHFSTHDHHIHHQPNEITMAASPSMPPSTADLATTWAFLEEGVDHIMTKLQTGVSYSKYMSLYTVAYNYCTSSRMHGTSEAVGTGSRSAFSSDLYRACVERVFCLQRART